MLTLDLYLWSLSEMATLIWLFFEDLDILQPFKTYFIIAKKPRKKLSIEDLSELPRAFKSYG